MKTAKNKKINEAIDLLMEGGADLKTVLKQDGLIKELTKSILERALQAEMSEHLGYNKYDRSETENCRNGNYNKNLITENGSIELNIPRDREGKFAPVIVSKNKTRIDGLDQKIISLYAKGMSLSDIKIQLHELYGAEVSESLISRVTDDIIDEVRIWQSRPLEALYPIVYFDCLIVKVRQDKQIINKSVYVALGIDLQGRKDILGLWISENEGSKFWLSNFTELKNRGLKDILIACSDNLTGMSEAICASYPKTEHQLCIVHQIRNSLKYVSYKDRKLWFCRIKVYLLYWDFIILSYCQMSIIRKAFRRLHYPIDVIALCVRCYLSYSLSLRNIEEMMAERGITLDHSTLHRWVVRLIPLMNKTFRKYKRQTSKHWRMHETYIKVKGKWQYLYRAVDKYGKTIDFLLTARRDTAAALRFFKKAISQHGTPEVVTIDKSGANTAALKVINKDKPEKEAIGILQNKYLNNMIEQDHRNIKRRIRPMLGLKSFRFAKIILGGIELIHMIRKGQFQHPGGTGLSNAQQFYLLAA